MIRTDTIEALERYVHDRIPTGGFLHAVLSNDLRGAFGRADVENREALFEIVQYCTWNIPGDCWGSPENVRVWLEGWGEGDDQGLIR